jgi:hypothetical protein
MPYLDDEDQPEKRTEKTLNPVITIKKINVKEIEIENVERGIIYQASNIKQKAINGDKIKSNKETNQDKTESFTNNLRPSNKGWNNASQEGREVLGRS